MLIKLVLFVAMAGGTAFAQAAQTPIVQQGNLIRTVANLDKSVAFYQDLLGLQMDPAAPAPTRPRADANMQKLTNAPGALFRSARFVIPGVDFGLLLTEFSGIDRHPARPRFQDPGSSSLALMVRDISTPLLALKKASVQVVTEGGVALQFPGNTRAVSVRDPDGFFVELVQFDPLPKTSAQSDSNVIRGRMGITISNTDQTIRFYRDVLGFHLTPAPAFSPSKLVMSLFNTPGAEWRLTGAEVPGTTGPWEFIEYREIDRMPYQIRPQDPGAAVFSFRVRDAETLLKSIQVGGGTVVSADGETVRGPEGESSVCVRDPNGFLLQLLQRP